MRRRVFALTVLLAGCDTSRAPAAPTPVDLRTPEERLLAAADTLNDRIRQYVRLGGRVDVSSGNVPAGESGYPIVIVAPRGISR